MSLDDLRNAVEISADMARQGVLLAYHRKALDHAIDAMWDDDNCSLHRKHLEPIVDAMLDFGDLQTAVDEIHDLRYELETGILDDDSELLSELKTAIAWIVQISSLCDILRNAERAAWKGARK